MSAGQCILYCTPQSCFSLLLWISVSPCCFFYFKRTWIAWWENSWVFVYPEQSIQRALNPNYHEASGLIVSPAAVERIFPSYIDQYTLYCSVLTTEHAYYWNMASMFLLKADMVSRSYRDWELKTGNAGGYATSMKGIQAPSNHLYSETFTCWSQGLNYEFSAFGKERWLRVGKGKEGRDDEPKLHFHLPTHEEILWLGLGDPRNTGEDLQWERCELDEKWLFGFCKRITG